MDLQTLVKTTDYVSQFKQHKVIYRNYKDLNLMIVKRKYGSDYSEDIPWLNECRGAIIDTSGTGDATHRVVFLPPSKSKELSTLSQFQQECSRYTELVDGTMINLFYHNGKWLKATRSNIGCNNQWSSDLNFKQMFDDCSETLDLQSLNQDNTYSFVMRHKKQRYTSPVDTNELVLVEMRNSSLERIPCETNEGYRVLQEVTTLKPLFKGYTAIKEGVRYKWLSNEHKFIQMIEPNTNNPCLNYLTLRNSGHLVSYLQLFPEKRYEFDIYRTKVQQLTQMLYEWYRGVFVQKQLDKTDIPFAIRPFLYEIHKIYLQQKQGIAFSRVKQYVYDLEPKRIQFCLNHL